MKSAIPQMIGFLSVNDDSLCKAGAEVLSNLSQEGSSVALVHLIFLMDTADTVVAAELRKLMESAIPQMIDFLTHDYDDSFHKAGAKTLSNLSQEGSIFNSLTLMFLTQ